MWSLKKCVMGTLLSLSAASSFATVIYSQDFSKGLQSNETITGKWSIENGALYRGVYENNERDTFTATFSLAGYKDIQLAYDYNLNTERCCDGLHTFIGGVDQGGLSGSVFGTYKATLNPSVTVFQLVFGSDFSIVGSGLSIDNIRITGAPIAPAVPEPAALSLIGIGSLGMMALRRRRSRTR